MEGNRKGSCARFLGWKKSIVGVSWAGGQGPDWELNWQPFSLQASTQSTEPQQPGQVLLVLIGGM